MTDENDELVEFKPVVTADDELIVTESAAAEQDIKAALDAVDGVDPDDGEPEKTPNIRIIEKLREIDARGSQSKAHSDGSTASYYELPEGAKELQDLISFKNMNAQMGEIGRAWYRYGQVAHSEKMRDAKKIQYYIEAEIARLEKYGD